MVNDVEHVFELDEAPAEVTLLAERRQLAHLQHEWTKADILRQQIAALGWTVLDTPEGQRLIRQS